jgi:membrane fusion protein, multidrug efflux system
MRRGLTDHASGTLVQQGKPRPAATITASLALLLSACGGEAEQALGQAAPPPPTVTVVPVIREDVTPSREFVGRVAAVDRVDLRARVLGFLEARNFTEGQYVQEGDLLFVIEQEPYEAVVAQRQAHLASAQAETANAQVQLQRGEQLIRNQNIPQAEVDQRRAALQVAQAKVLEAEAAVRSAQLDVGYTEIHAPIAGRIGRAAYSVGNLVGPDSGTLALIVSQDPVYVTFPISQQILTELRQRSGARAGRSEDLVVRLGLPDGSAYEHPGVINFADVQVDPGTDTVTIRAEFPNPDELLTPGQFVDVSVETATPTTALVVPQNSLQVDQAGPYVLVVGADDMVEARRVELGARQGADVVVEAGLQEGESIIVEGIQKVRPGQKVQPTAGSPRPIPAAALVPGGELGGGTPALPTLREQPSVTRQAAQ